MGVLELRIAPRLPFGLLNPDRVIEALKENFPEVSVFPEDARKQTLEQAEQVLAKANPEVKDYWSNRMWSNALANGPEYRFALPFTEHGIIKGYIHRQLIAFCYPEPLDSSMEARLQKFLSRFGIGVIKKTSNAKHLYFVEETVCTSI
jgi:hypothetical protein